MSRITKYERREPTMRSSQVVAVGPTSVRVRVGRRYGDVIGIKAHDVSYILHRLAHQPAPIIWRALGLEA